MEASQTCHTRSRIASLNKRFSVLRVLGLGAIVLFITASALAHTCWMGDVPRKAPAEVVPTVDGIRGPTEYPTALWWPLVYRPRADFDPARIYLVTTDSDLYMFFENLPDGGTWNRYDYLTVIFDTAHDGGRVPRSDDIQFELGHRWVGDRVLRGDNTSGFVPDPSIVGWEAQKRYPDGDHWNLELRIPLALIGDGNPHTTVGFYVGHHQLMETEGNDYKRPPAANAASPCTWADLVWQEASSYTIPCVDVIRVTQGLELQGNTA